ncbi:hypothetical protein DID77_04515 [Candidatus Marinamargulisbacteria bacterium SCGC AG-439-L15]|nr:hypothetical protein DID77_04515 [Candidatus Marinamargulisbacteria bacterium SCGC AG-439-L15]
MPEGDYEDAFKKIGADFVFKEKVSSFSDYMLNMKDGKTFGDAPYLLDSDLSAVSDDFERRTQEMHAFATENGLKFGEFLQQVQDSVLESAQAKLTTQSSGQRQAFLIRSNVLCRFANAEALKIKTDTQPLESELKGLNTTISTLEQNQERVMASIGAKLDEPTKKALATEILTAEFTEKEGRAPTPGEITEDQVNDKVADSGSLTMQLLSPSTTVAIPTAIQADSIEYQNNAGLLQDAKSGKQEKELLLSAALQDNALTSFANKFSKKILELYSKLPSLDGGYNDIALNYLFQLIREAKLEEDPKAQTIAEELVQKMSITETNRVLSEIAKENESVLNLFEDAKDKIAREKSNVSGLIVDKQAKKFIDGYEGAFTHRKIVSAKVDKEAKQAAIDEFQTFLEDKDIDFMTRSMVLDKVLGENTGLFLDTLETLSPEASRVLLSYYTGDKPRMMKLCNKFLYTSGFKDRFKEVLMDHLMDTDESLDKQVQKAIAKDDHFGNRPAEAVGRLTFAGEFLTALSTDYGQYQIVKNVLEETVMKTSEATVDYKKTRRTFGLLDKNLQNLDNFNDLFLKNPLLMAGFLKDYTLDMQKADRSKPIGTNVIQQLIDGSKELGDLSWDDLEKGTDVTSSRMESLHLSPKVTTLDSVPPGTGAGAPPGDGDGAGGEAPLLPEIPSQTQKESDREKLQRERMDYVRDFTLSILLDPDTSAETNRERMEIKEQLLRRLPSEDPDFMMAMVRHLDKSSKYSAEDKESLMKLIVNEQINAGKLNNLVSYLSGSASTNVTNTEKASFLSKILHQVSPAVRETLLQDVPGPKQGAVMSTFKENSDLMVRTLKDYKQLVGETSFRGFLSGHIDALESHFIDESQVFQGYDENGKEVDLDSPDKVKQGVNKEVVDAVAWLHSACEASKMSRPKAMDDMIALLDLKNETFSSKDFEGIVVDKDCTWEGKDYKKGDKLDPDRIFQKLVDQGHFSDDGVFEKDIDEFFTVTDASGKPKLDAQNAEITVSNGVLPDTDTFNQLRDILYPPEYARALLSTVADMQGLEASSQLATDLSDSLLLGNAPHNVDQQLRRDHEQSETYDKRIDEKDIRQELKEFKDKIAALKREQHPVSLEDLLSRLRGPLSAATQSIGQLVLYKQMQHMPGYSQPGFKS